jgi:WD40 repeat protein
VTIASSTAPKARGHEWAATNRLANLAKWLQSAVLRSTYMPRKDEIREGCELLLAVATSVALLAGIVNAEPNYISSILGMPVNNTISKLEELPARTNRVDIWALDFSPDARQIAIGSNFQVDVWDWKEKRLVVTIPLPEGVNPQFDVNAVQFSPDGSLLAILVDGAAKRLVVRVLNAKDWTIAKDIRDEKSVGVVGLAFTPDSKYLLTANDMMGSAGDSITSYAIDTWTAVWGLNLGFYRPIAIAVSPDGRNVAVDGELTIRPPPEVTDVTERIRQVKRKWQVHIVNLSTRSIGHTADSEACGQMAWNSNGSRVAVVGNSSFEIYDANTGARVLHSSEPGKGTQSVRLTSDGRYFIDSDANAMGTGRGLQLWDAKRQKLLTSVRGNIWSIAVSRDSSLLATGGDGHVTIWQLKSTKE